MRSFKNVLALSILLLSPLAHAGPNSIVITQRNATDNGNVIRTTGASVILCPTAGIFTISAAEQTAG